MIGVHGVEQIVITGDEDDAHARVQWLVPMISDFYTE